MPTTVDEKLLETLLEACVRHSVLRKFSEHVRERKDRPALKFPGLDEGIIEGILRGYHDVESKDVCAVLYGEHGELLSVWRLLCLGELS